MKGMNGTKATDNTNGTEKNKGFDARVEVGGGSACRVGIASAAQAHRAARLLEGRMIGCRVTHGSSRGRGGCGYALEYDCRQHNAVLGILERGGIGYVVL